MSHALTAPPASKKIRPSIAMAGEAGAGAPLLAALLAGILSARQPSGKKWKVQDASLVSTALAARTFPDRLHTFLLNESEGPLTRAVEDIMAVHPQWSAMAKAAASGVKNLFRNGHVIMLSRDAHLLTSACGDILRLLVTAPTEARVRQVESAYRLSHREAVKTIARCDRAWAAYLRKNFHCAGNTPEDFDLTINLGFMSPREAVDLIADAVFALERQLLADPLHPNRQGAMV